MNRWQRLGVVGLCLAMTVAAGLPSMLRAAVPWGAQPATPWGTRSATDLIKDIAALDQKISGLLPTWSLLADPGYRAGDGQKVLPLLKNAIALLSDLDKAVKADPTLKDDADLALMVYSGLYRTKAGAAVLGDKEITAALEAQSKEKSPGGVAATAALAATHWILASQDAAAQQKILDDFTAVAKANAEDSQVFQALSVMMNLGPANEEMGKKVLAVIRANLKGPQAQGLLAQIDGEQAQKALVGKPFAVQGRTSTGGTFNSADYKGKVVMLDFWATWCGPCLGELPNVQKTYATYHDQGFEIVGLSCDSADDVLNTFIKDKKMPWVQLRESSQTEADRWHPLAKQYHVDGIPQMFLIDRDGILRHIDARENLDKKVAALVAETAKPAGK